MHKGLKMALISLSALASSGCSVFGNPGVEIAPYKVLNTEDEIEVREYERLVLVSTPMASMKEDQGAAFKRLFGYISGENISAEKIDMTAPVLTESGEPQGQKIAMTAPVFMGGEEDPDNRRMSFVLPSSFDLDSAPRPTNPDVFLTEVTDLNVATITFSGSLTESNAATYRKQLERWIERNGYRVTGAYQTAGYNPPWTLPNMRRNEVLIPVVKR